VTSLAPRRNTIPAELRRRSWVLWAAEPDASGGKPQKVPRQVAWPSRPASSTDPSTWASFSDVCEAYSALTEDPRWSPLKITGVGVVLVGDGLVCVDLDGAITPEGLTPAAARIVREVPTYTEVSPSGQGLHLWVLGELARALTSRTLEAYDRGRYICVTGERYPGTPPEVEPAPRLIQLIDDASKPEPPGAILSFAITSSESFGGPSEAPDGLLTVG
jgi:primase-polymerase (primpol)-like protein